MKIYIEHLETYELKEVLLKFNAMIKIPKSISFMDMQILEK